MLVLQFYYAGLTPRPQLVTLSYQILENTLSSQRAVHRTGSLWFLNDSLFASPLG